jgi:hypothetical protein
MNWSDERYVRLYTRDSTDWRMWAWQARCVLPLLLRKVDRAGRLDLGKYGLDGLAVMLDIPAEVAEPGIKALLADGCVTQTDSVLVVCNFIEAQEAVASDKQRARWHREKLRTEAMGQDAPAESENVTNRDDGITNRDATVTNREEKSRAVTRRHAASRGVTPSRAVPCRAVPSRTEDQTPTESVAGGSAIPTTKAEKRAGRKPTPTASLAEKFEAKRMASGKPNLVAIKPPYSLIQKVWGEGLGREVAKRGEDVALRAFDLYLAEDWPAANGWAVENFLFQWGKFLQRAVSLTPQAWKTVDPAWAERGELERALEVQRADPKAFAERYASGELDEMRAAIAAKEAEVRAAEVKHG